MLLLPLHYLLLLTILSLLSFLLLFRFQTFLSWVLPGWVSLFRCSASCAVLPVCPLVSWIPLYSAALWPVFWVFCSAARYPGRRFPSVPLYMLGLSVFIFVGLYCLLPVFGSWCADCSEWFGWIASSTPGTFFLVGDFNICHPSLSDTVASPNAAMLYSVTFDFSLCCLNSGLPTHYYRSTDSFLCIDLSFGSSSILLHFTWSRLSSFFGSDIIRFFCLWIHPSLPSGSSRWNFDCVNWAGFSLPTEVSTLLSSFASVNAALGFFNDLILDPANNLIPRVQGSWVEDLRPVSFFFFFCF